MGLPPFGLPRSASAGSRGRWNSTPPNITWWDSPLQSEGLPTVPSEDTPIQGLELASGAAPSLPGSDDRRGTATASSQRVTVGGSGDGGTEGDSAGALPSDAAPERAGGGGGDGDGGQSDSTGARPYEWWIGDRNEDGERINPGSPIAEVRGAPPSLCIYLPPTLALIPYLYVGNACPHPPPQPHICLPPYPVSVCRAA